MPTRKQIKNDGEMELTQVRGTHKTVMTEEEYERAQRIAVACTRGGFSGQKGIDKGGEMGYSKAKASGVTGGSRMYKAEAAEEYLNAYKAGRGEVRELQAAGKRSEPVVLDELLEHGDTCAVVEVGCLEIPAERIVGTKSAGRTAALSPGFRPLLPPETEFAAKWRTLCEAHLGATGIRDPILCYEYLGAFYVQEGNKRVSVLRHFGAPEIRAQVKRVMPPRSEEPRIRAYYEFLDFFRSTQLYTIQFRRPGDYEKLLKHLGKEPGAPWTQQERSAFRANYALFREALTAAKLQGVLPEEALLLWLELYPYERLPKTGIGELKKSLAALAEDMVTAGNKEQAVKLEERPTEPEKGNLLGWLRTPERVEVAFVHQLDPRTSSWVLGHEMGACHMKQVFGDRVDFRSYDNADTPEEADRLIAQAVADGAQIVFTTAPTLIRPTLKAAVANPKVRFYNCSVNQPYASVQTYYGRIYEGKFITGAIAGAMTTNDRIGYIATDPIFGVPASINAFALGAQMTNPRAKICLRWSCCAGSHQADLFADGIRVVSNRDVPTGEKVSLDYCDYGTYLLDEAEALIPLASPVWAWGKFYEKVIDRYLSGAKREDRDGASAVNYWMGMDSGVVEIKLSDRLPAGVRSLAEMLIRAMVRGELDPFHRQILAQDGSVKNDGSRTFTLQERLHMDWLCENVAGKIPDPDRILPRSRRLVEELGIYKEQGKGAAYEDPGHSG